MAMFELWLYYQLLFATLINKKYMGKRNNIIMWLSIIVLGLLQGINRAQIFFSNIMFWFVIVAMIFCTYMLYQMQAIVISGLVLVYFSFVALGDFGISFLGMAILGNRFGELVYLRSVEDGKLLIYILTRLIMLVIVWIIKKNKVSKEVIEFRGVLLGLGIISAVLVRRYRIMLGSMVLGISDINWQQSIMSLVMSIMFISFVGIIFIKDKMIKRENLFLNMKDEMEKQKYKEIIASVERNNVLIHDIKNHYVVISELERNRQYKELHQYITELDEGFGKVEPLAYTGNQVIDLVLSQKMMIAEQENISFELQTAPVLKIKLKERELCSIFGNLLDNAIESCKKMEDEKWIKVKIERKNQLFFIEIANSINQEPYRKGNVFLSTKKDKNIHGYGIKSVQRIVAEYEGAISIDTRNKSFIVRMTFFDVG